MRASLIWIVTLSTALLAGTAAGATLSREQALAALAQADPIERFVAVERLASVGVMDDADAVLQRLADADMRVRISAGNAIWQIWSRSGDPVIDELLASGVGQLQAAALTDALATFNEVVRRQPTFAEGWNKRATVYYLLGEYEKSLQDCVEVFKRNPRHFGALAGAGQIHLRRGRAGLALEFFRRAVAVNPNLEGPAQMIPLLEEYLRDQDKNKT